MPDIVSHCLKLNLVETFYTEQKWKNYILIVRHLHTKYCKPVKQMKMYLYVQRLGYA